MALSDIFDAITSFVATVITSVLVYFVMAAVLVAIAVGIAVVVDWCRSGRRRLVQLVRRPNLMVRPLARRHPGIQRYLLRRAQHQTERAMVRLVMDHLLRDWQGRR
jgi:hypothetical protein